MESQATTLQQHDVRGLLFLKTHNGAVAVEAAIIVPILMVLVFGIIEFGLLLYDQQVITNASREGARAAIVGDCANRLTDEQIIRIVTDYCVNSKDPAKKRLITFSDANSTPSVSVNPSPANCTPGGGGLTAGDDVAVTASYTYTFLLPSLLGFGPTKQLGARTVMKMESAP